MKNAIIVQWLALSLVCACKSDKIDYKNSKLPVKERVENLIAQMTLEEKAAQLYALSDGGNADFDEKFFQDSARTDSVFRYGIGYIQPSQKQSIRETVERRNRIQKFLMEKTRLGIPAIFMDEGLHGLMRNEATVYPQAIGLACSWDTALFREVFTHVAAEARSRGTHMFLSPVIDVCRDPRWGRVEETYGEDPWLNGILGAAAVKGIQGSCDGTIAPDHVAATLKHFTGHAQPENGLNQNPVNISTRTLLEMHMLPFKICINEARPVALMPSYNDLDGVPSHGNKWLLQEVLRKQLKFNGMIVSDYTAINQLLDKHFVAKDSLETATLAFNSGVEFELPVPKFYTFLPQLIREGKVDENEIDNAVAKILKLKFELGLFENPYVEVDKAHKIATRESNRELALKAAHRSIVLLKNANNLVPLSMEKYRKIAVIGPCANQAFLGGYSGTPFRKTSILEGIKQKVGDKASVLYAEGCKITCTPDTNSFDNWVSDEIILPAPDQDKELINEAVSVAKSADIVILVIGENERICREAWSASHLGDQATLDLFGQQNQLTEAIVKTGKPVIVYLMHGRPLSVNYIAQHVPVIFDGWYAGQETGNAFADILFGDVCPSGKLTISVAKSAGHLPVFYNHKPSARQINYVNTDVQPLFPFGFGLSYTSFEYSKPELEKNTIKRDEQMKVSVTIKNTGTCKGEEIVQLYIRDKVSAVSRPVKELKDFTRISLNAGESRKVVFQITPEKLQHYGTNMELVVEPGEFEVMIGKNSSDLQMVSFWVK